MIRSALATPSRSNRSDGSLTLTPLPLSEPSTGPDRCCTTCVSSCASTCLPESEAGSYLPRWNTMLEPTV